MLLLLLASSEQLLLLLASSSLLLLLLMLPRAFVRYSSASGGMKRGVPATPATFASWLSVRACSWSCCRASLQSNSFIVKSGWTPMLSGLMSRWMIPWWGAGRQAGGARDTTGCGGVLAGCKLVAVGIHISCSNMARADVCRSAALHGRPCCMQIMPAQHVHLQESVRCMRPMPAQPACVSMSCIAGSVPSSKAGLHVHVLGGWQCSNLHWRAVGVCWACSAWTATCSLLSS